jgi:hypothetical protein
MTEQKTQQPAGCMTPLVVLAVLVGVPTAWLMFQVQSCQDEAEKRQLEREAVESPKFEAAKQALRQTPPRTLADATRIIGEDPLRCDEDTERCTWVYATHGGSRRITVEAQPIGAPLKLRNGSPVRDVSVD